MGDAVVNELENPALLELTGFYLCDPATRQPWTGRTFPGVRAYMGQFMGRDFVGSYARKKFITRVEALQEMEGSMEAQAEIGRHDPMGWQLQFMLGELRSHNYTYNDLQLALLRHVYTWRWDYASLAAHLGADAPKRLAVAVGPIRSGKSHTGTKMGPLWALCHGHVRFMLYASDTQATAEEQFAWYVGEGDPPVPGQPDTRGVLVKNKKLTTVFPGMGEWSKSGDILRFRNGANAKANSFESAWRGTMIGAQEPDLLIGDDIDPRGSNVKPETREESIRAFTGRGSNARVLFASTTTKKDYPTHQLLKSVLNDADPPAYAERYGRLYVPAIVEDNEVEGGERSLHPGSPMPMFQMEGVEGLKAARKAGADYWRNELNNRPSTGLGLFYTEDLFHFINSAEEFEAEHWLQWVDPALTANPTSDWTGSVFIGRGARGSKDAGRLCIVRSGKVRAVGEQRRRWLEAEVAAVQQQHGITVAGRVIEINAGGESMAGSSEFGPTRLQTRVFRVKRKDDQGMDIGKVGHFIRAAQWLRAGKVVFLGDPSVVEDMRRFNGIEAGKKGSASDHDDVMDATVTGILMELEPEIIGGHRAIAPYRPTTIGAA